MELNINQIIEDCKANDHKAFETIYLKYYRILLGISHRYTANTAEAEDVLQESFIKIFNNIKQFDNKGSFEGWLKRIVQNTAITYYHKRRKVDFTYDVDHYEEEIPDENIQEALDESKFEDVIQVLNSLPEGYRMVINLYYIDGHSYKEIADLLQIQEGTVKSQLYKAKRQMRERLSHFKNSI